MNALVQTRDTAFDTAAYATQAAPSANDEWIWTILQKEIDANPNLTEANQN